MPFKKSDQQPVSKIRNKNKKKLLKNGFGKLPEEIALNRVVGVEFQIATKHRTHWAGCDEKIS